MDGGSWFVSFCSFASRRFPALVKIGSKHLERIRKKKVEKKPANPRIPVLSWKGGKKDSGSTQASRVEKSLRFTGTSLMVEEVLAAAWLAGILASLAVVAAVVLVFILGGFGPMLYFLPFASIAPIAAYSLIMNYPEARARRMRIRSLGSAPEAVTYMAMSLKLSPSLNKAIEFAAENTEGPLADRLRGVMWDVYSRRKESIEESFMGFANDWGEWNDDL
jgi:Flp pilus assembly protein TadB